MSKIKNSEFIFFIPNLNVFKKFHKLMEGTKMKTLKLAFGLFMVMQLMAGLVYAQDEIGIPTAGQLILSRNVAAVTDSEEDDLYAALMGTGDSPLVNDPMLDSIKGPQKAQASSIIVKQESAPFVQPSGTDLYGAAANYLTYIVNPDSYELLSVTFIESDTLIFTFGLGAGLVDVAVDISTAQAFMDAMTLEHCTELRADIAYKMQKALSDVRINGVEGIDGFESIHLYDWYFTISARVDDLTLNFIDWEHGYEYVPAEGLGREYGKLLLTSITNAAGIDLYKSAIDNLMATVNPDVYTLASWQMNENGALVFKFKLQDDSFIDITVDLVSGNAWMNDANLAKVIINSRYAIARNMGLPDISDVHINAASITYIDYGGPWYGYRPWPPLPTSITNIAARVGDYALTLSSTEYNWWVDLGNDLIKHTAYGADLIPIEESYELDPEPYYKPAFTLTSFIDMRTGVDYVAQAERDVLNLLNMLSPNPGIGSWSVASGKLVLYVSAHKSIDPWLMWLGDPISVEIDLATGAIAIDPVVVDLVTKTRGETSQKLNISMADVHVNFLSQHYGGKGDIYFPDGWDIYISTPSFSLGYFYKNDGTITLVSLCSNAAGVDLYGTAVVYLNETANPDEFILDSWGLNPDGTVNFNFKLRDGSIIGINVAADGSSVSFTDNYIKDALLKTRQNIAEKSGLDISEVHINGVKLDWHLMWESSGWVYPSLRGEEIQYTLAANIGNYSLGLVYNKHEDSGWIYYNLKMPGEEGSSMPPIRVRSWTTVALTSFVDTITGRDLLVDARNNFFDLFNPEYFMTGPISEWSIKNGVLTLGMYLQGDFRKLYYSTDTIPSYIGFCIPVQINLATGLVTIDPFIAEAVTNARQEISQNLGIAIGDVHVNGVAPSDEWVLVEEHRTDGDVWVTFPAVYTIMASAGDFNVTINYDNLLHSTKLVAIVSRVRGIDLYGKAVDMLMNVVNPSGYTLQSWYLQENTLRVRFALANGSIISITVDGVSGSAYMKPYQEAFLETRQEIAARIGVDILEVRVNEYQTLQENTGDPYQVGMTYFRINASANDLTVTMDYRPMLAIPEGSMGSITLISIMNRNGADLYRNAVNLLLQNGQSEFTLASWEAAEGLVNFAFTLQDGLVVKVGVDIATGKARFSQTDLYGAAEDLLVSVANPEEYNLQYVLFMGPDTLIFGFDIGEGTVEIYANIVMGSVSMEPELKSALLAARNEVSTNLGCGIADVTIIGVEALIHVPEEPQSYRITARNGELTIKMIVKSGSSETPPVVTLESILNAAGTDLYRSAIDCLGGVFNPGAAISLSFWRLTTAGEIIFGLTLPDNSEIAVIVNIYTGEARFHPKSGGIKEAALAVRDDIATRMGVDIGEVHLIGFALDYACIPGDISKGGLGTVVNYILTATVRNFTIKMSCAVENIPRDFPPYGSDYYVRSIVLASLVNNDNGIDLYSKAIESLQYDYNPDEVILSEWNFREGLDSGDIIRESTLNFQFELPDGGTISYIFLTTGEPTFSFNECRAVREEFAIKSGISLSDVHVNQMPEEWVMVTPEVIIQSFYTLTTEKFTVVMGHYRYIFYGTSSILLESFISRESGIDLFKTSMTYVRERYGQNTGIVNWIVHDDFVAFGWMLDTGEIINVNVNIMTGEIISSSEIKDDQSEELTQNYPDSQALAEETDSGSAVVNQQPESDQADFDGNGAENQDGNQPMPGWMQELLDSIMEKNSAKPKGGGSANRHTYEQMADSSQNNGLALRWKR